MKRELHTFIIGSVLFFTACGDKQESEQKSGYRIQGDTVYIADPLLLEKIKVSVSELKPYSKKVITSGVVRPIPPRYAYVAPPFAGRVTKSYVRIGQSVRQGTPLFEISSPDFTSAQKEYFQALSSRELAKKDLTETIRIIVDDNLITAINKKRAIHPLSVEIRNEIILNT